MVATDTAIMTYYTIQNNAGQPIRAEGGNWHKPAFKMSEFSDVKMVSQPMPLIFLYCMALTIGLQQGETKSIDPHQNQSIASKIKISGDPMHR